jgi:hypothetical protein
MYRRGRGEGVFDRFTTHKPSRIELSTPGSIVFESTGGSFPNISGNSEPPGAIESG